MRTTAHYTDGRTATRHEVTVMAGAGALRVHGAGGELLAEWPYAELELAEEVYGNAPVRLRHRSVEGATLTLADAALLHEIEARAGRRLAGRAWLPATRRRVWGLLALLAVVVALMLWSVPRLVTPLAMLVPAEHERALGERVAERFTARQGACEGEAGLAALRRLTGRLAAGAAAPWPVRVRVTRGEAVNAFAAPGGQIVFLRGMIEAARTPEELAGVLAHEIAHGLERHPTEKLIRTVGLSLVLNALFGDASALEGSLGRLTQVLVLNAYTRQDEREADRRGLALLNAADIRGDGLVRLLERLRAQGQGAGTPALLSSHPLHGERIARLRGRATGTRAALSPEEWQAVQAVCE